MYCFANEHMKDHIFEPHRDKIKDMNDHSSYEQNLTRITNRENRAYSHKLRLEWDMNL